ncbi:MAG: glycyl-radical enzyme activating protein [Bacteroidales bacterium]|nr:glycyl-radical enzyme activating protein [Bacteroidales bacterium]
MALIFDIKRYAIHDGPGIRTTIFVKGCPLRCVWCHNPESWSPKPQRLYKQGKCIGCCCCIDSCPQGALKLTPGGIRPTENQCILCGTCASVCPTLAMEICGREWPMEELMAEIEKERGVMTDSGGGVTLSGGEPMMHPDFTLKLLKELGQRGFHRAVDTTFYADPKIVEAIAKECELFLLDIKCMDSATHKLYTGVPNELIHSNLRIISKMGKPYWVRIPLITEVNATEDNIQATADFLTSLPTKPEVVDLLPYHDIGKGKHERMGTKYNPEGLSLTAPDPRQLARCEQILTSSGLKVRIGG